MTTSTRRRRSVALVAVLILMLGACGDDDADDAGIDDGTDDGGALDDADSANTDGESASTQGQGTLVLDGHRFVSDIVICELDGPGDEPTEFSYAGTGTLDGTPFSINATIGILDTGGPVTIIDGLTVIDETGTSALYETAPDTADRVASQFSIDGRGVTYDAEFVGADGESSAGRGSFEVTCP